jgi:tripartite ATP-independent transporter DctM subunit
MLIVFLVGLFLLVFLNVPIAFCLICTAILMMIFSGAPVTPQILTQNLIKGIDSFPLLAIPFFVFAGEIMNVGGISKRIVRFSQALVGHIAGGLGFVGVISSMIFAGVSGSAIADTTAVGSVLLPMMKESNYDVNKSTALICSSGCMGPVIPPSVPMILFGVTCGVSIVKLFSGGIIPGVLIGLALMAIWYFQAKKYHYKSEIKVPFKEVLKAFKEAIWAIILPVLILVAIVSGLATPTESAVIAVAYAFIVGVFVYKELKISDMPRILLEGSVSTAVIMFLVGGATSAAYLITVAHIPELLTDTLLAISNNPYVLLLLINILILLVGCVMDLSPAILILAPIMLPLVVKMGYDPIYFGVIMVVNLCIGLLTPPVGSVMYVGCGLSKISMLDFAKASWTYLAAMVVVLLIITYCPALIMFIPKLFS